MFSDPAAHSFQVYREGRGGGGGRGKKLKINQHRDGEKKTVSQTKHTTVLIHVYSLYLYTRVYAIDGNRASRVIVVVTRRSRY